MNDEIEEPVDAEEITKEARANPHNIDAEVSFHPGALVSDAKDYKATHRTTVHLNTMEIDMKNIDKDDQMTCRTIYESVRK